MKALLTCPYPCLPTRPLLQVNYQLTLPAVKEALTFKPGQERHLPIVTGFLGRGLQTGAITTLGRGGSDLTCTLLGASLGLPEVQVRAWGQESGIVRLCMPAERMRCGQTFASRTRCHGRALPCTPMPPRTLANPNHASPIHPLCPILPSLPRCGRMWTAC